MTVKFKSPETAQACIVKMNGRFFDGRKVSLLSLVEDSPNPGRYSLGSITAKNGIENQGRMRSARMSRRRRNGWINLPSGSLMGTAKRNDASLLFQDFFYPLDLGIISSRCNGPVCAGTDSNVGLDNISVTDFLAYSDPRSAHGVYSIVTLADYLSSANVRHMHIPSSHRPMAPRGLCRTRYL